MAFGFRGRAELTARADEPAAPTARDGRWVLAATIIASSMGFLDSTVVNVALPVLQRDLGADITQSQWVVEGYILFMASLIMVGGALGDRHGRRRIFNLGIAIFAVASLLCGLAMTPLQLNLARAVQGIGAALMIPGSLALISACFPESRRGRAIGTWSAATAITVSLGPVFGGWAVDALSWRWIFFINPPLAILALAISHWRVPESRAECQPPDWTGAALGTLALAAITFGLLDSVRLGFGHPLVWGALLLGLLAAVAFLWVEAVSQAPMLPLDLFRSATFSGVNALTFTLYAGLQGSLFFLPFNLIQVQGYSAFAAGAAMLPFVAMISLLSRWAGGLVDRFGPRPPLVTGTLITALGFALFALPGIGGSYWTGYFPAALVLGLGMGVCVAPVTTVALNAAGPDRAGVASAINNTVARVGGLIAVALFGIVLAAFFNQALDAGLAAIAPPPDVLSALDAERIRLAAAELPAGLDPDLANALRNAINEAFINGFRAVMVLSTLLAAGSALIAWMSLDRQGACDIRAGRA